TAPSGLIATAASSSQINLVWTDNSTNEANFHVDRCQGSGCSSFTQIAQLPAGTTSYSSTGLSASTTYNFRVRATNVTDSTASNADEATTHAQSPATSMHVGGLSGDGVKAGGPNWFAQVTILVHDNNGNPVANATANGAWSNGATGAASCLTNGSGTCTVNSPTVHNRVGSVTFTVNGITHSALTYNAGDNVQTSIVVAK
ncbi:MAG TPA: fibronectin type III domain-containing protein, partial [Vicinamibacterales bacterium]|nr:fibronectin type III domain-containing protein [Vicinamibacterales bacterium]